MQALSPKIHAIGAGEYRDKADDEIRGSGYVVESLEAALWCFLKTDTFRDAILKAVNLGDDADTTAAVCGQITGAFYGQAGIPQDCIVKAHQMLADQFRAGRKNHTSCASERVGFRAA